MSYLDAARRLVAEKRGIVVLCVVAVLALFAPGHSFAAKPKDYSHVFLRGRITDPYEKKPMAAATVRLTADSGVFEAVTDPMGVFVFEKLPVTTFRLDIVAADGQVVRWFDEPDLSDPGRPRVKVKFGKTRGRSTVTLAARPESEKVEVIVEAPPARWGRFWKQLGIFAAGALILAL